jgi:uncharacterized repeat protein (TIGR01451 family)
MTESTTSRQPCLSGTVEPVYRLDQTDRRSMFRELWIVVAVLLTLVGIALRQTSLLLAPLLFLAIHGVAQLWRRNTFRGVFYRRRFTPQRTFAGETVELTIELENRKLLPLSWVRVTDVLPDGITLENTHDAAPTIAPSALYDVFALRWFERLRRRYRVRCHRRGYFRFGPARLISGDVFGLTKMEAQAVRPDWLIVYPRVYPIEDLGLPSKDPLGDLKARQVIFEDPLRIVGVREHQPGDSFRRVHWKASARHQELRSKVYEPATSHKLALFLNVATFEQPWRGTISEVLEQLISITASLANHAIERRYAVGVIANSSVPNSSHHIKVPPGRSPQQMTRILEALAAVTPIAPASIERLLIEECPKLSRGATLVLVTSVLYDALSSTLLHLTRAGRRIVLITLGDLPPNPLLEQHLRIYRLAMDRFGPTADGEERAS